MVFYPVEDSLKIINPCKGENITLIISMSPKLRCRKLNLRLLKGEKLQPLKVVLELARELYREKSLVKWRLLGAGNHLF